MDPRTYLLDRFRGDAVALRARANALRSGPPQPGPDAVTSGRMADACDDVVAVLTAILPTVSEADSIAALSALVPLFEKRGAAVSHGPAVRSVYVGAATRIREIAAAEARDSLSRRDGDSVRDSSAGDDDDIDNHTDSDIDDDDVDDDDLDDTDDEDFAEDIDDVRDEESAR